MPLFTRRGDVAEEVSVGRPARAASEIAGSLRSIQAVNLSDRPKALFVIGAGNTGKTTFLRWVTERLNEKGSQDGGCRPRSREPGTAGLFRGCAGAAEPRSGRDPRVAGAVP